MNPRRKKTALCTSLLILWSLGPAGLPAQTSIPATPESLGESGWQVSGVPEGALQTGAGDWTLPAGAQILRLFTAEQSASAVAVTLSAQPRFAVQAEDTTMLELGDEALVFLRTEAGGELLLFSGGKALHSLPGSVPLDATGRSTGLLTVQLSYDPDLRVYSATAFGRTFALPVAAHQQPPAKFALSTGVDAGLPIAALQLDFIPVAGDETPAGAPPPESASATAKAAAQARTVQDAAQQRQALLERALQWCLAGRFDAAWAALQENPDQSARAAELGWRAATVVGLLKNQSRYAEAERLARLALRQPWRAGTHDAQVRYWTAWITLEGLGDRSQALQALGEAGPAEAASAAPLRTRLQESLQSFPGP